MPTEEELAEQLAGLSSELSRRANRAAVLDRYHDGDHPVPEAVTASKATRAYQAIMQLADTNWPQLIVDSVEERLEVQGIDAGDDELSKRAWESWQENQLDAESGLAHESALTCGRSFVIVWPRGDGQLPEITPEHASTTIVEYADGSRHVRKAALRRWTDGNRWFATLYRPDGVYKFQSTKTAKDGPVGKPPAGGEEWERRDVAGEEWPVKNALTQYVPVVELAVNRKLTPGKYGSAKGEFERNTGHIDRINFATFAQIVAMTWSGFPMRALIGQKILRDDDGNALAPFDVTADRVVVIENPDGKLIQLPEADLENYGRAIDRYVMQLAALTKTPPHYLLGELVNLSADAIRAAEAGLVSKVRRHHRALGEKWEDVSRLALLAVDPTLDLARTRSAAIVWKDPESRSQAERADAASKLANILPWQVLAAKILGATPTEVSQWEAMRSSDQLGGLLAPSPTPEP